MEVYFKGVLKGVPKNNLHNWMGVMYKVALDAHRFEGCISCFGRVYISRAMWD